MANLVDATGHFDHHTILKTPINTGFLRTPADDFACLSHDQQYSDYRSDYMASFKDGDTVRLKSGGPLMTIQSIYKSDSQDWAEVVWFDDKKKQCTERYRLIVLEPDDGGFIV